MKHWLVQVGSFRMLSLSMLMKASVSVSVIDNSADILLTVQETCGATASRRCYQNNIHLTEVWTMWDCVVALFVWLLFT